MSQELACSVLVIPRCMNERYLAANCTRNADLFVEAEHAKIFVEVAHARRQGKRLDARRFARSVNAASARVARASASRAM